MGAICLCDREIFFAVLCGFVVCWAVICVDWQHRNTRAKKEGAITMASAKQNGHANGGGAVAAAPAAVDPAALGPLKKDAAAKGGGSADGGGMGTELKLLCSVFGIYICYLTSGMLQENIYSFRAPDGGRFGDTMFMLAVQCLVNVVVAFVLLRAVGGSGQRMPHRLFALAGCAYIGAMLCSMEALKYVNFPTKELGKSCKMIPVMLFGVLFARKRYSAAEYFCVALITAGIVTFNLGGASKHKGGGADNSAYGLGLLAFSLALDGVTGSAQERLKAACRPTALEMMLHMNLWALLIMTAMSVATGQGSSGIAFCAANPSVATWLAGFALTAAAGQNFIYYTIRAFNPLVCTTITTTRKFFTILCSVVVFGHPMKPQQWCGVALVFAGIGGEMFGKYRKHHTGGAAKKKK
ncbi:unnamed protein product [Phaeothamnion confervicola]